MMTRIDRIRYAIARLMLAALLGAGAVFFLTGCNAVSGLGRDLTQTSELILNGIPAYYAGPQAQQRHDDGLTASQRRQLGW